MDTEKIEQRIKQIEEEIKSLPYHKGTEHHIGKLKARLAQLRDANIKGQARKKGGGGDGFAVRKHGDATVVLVGMPSVGKSTLLNKLTGTESKVGSYPFTTLDVIPGVLGYKKAKIQIFDVPGLISGASAGRGGGKEILSVVRVADLILLVASAEEPRTFHLMEKELWQTGVRLNQEKPKISIEKRLKGGIEILGNPGAISKENVKMLAREFRVLNAKIAFKQRATQDQLIDALMANRVYAPALRILSKVDLLPQKELEKISKQLGKDCLLISARDNIGIDELKEKIFSRLDLIRIYLRKSAGATPDSEPLICKEGATVLTTAQKISEALAQEITGAKVKGLSALYPNQLVGLKHKLKDKDQLFFIK